MIFTDPPYGIGKEIENDNLKREDWTEFYILFTGNMLDFVIDNYIDAYKALISYKENMIFE
jgi:DNA modification methylase